MALSNRERVGRTFECLAAGLGPWVDRRLTAPGAWHQIVGEVDARNLDPHEEGQARKRSEDADRRVELRLAEAYQWLLSPHQPLANGPIEWDTYRVVYMD